MVNDVDNTITNAFCMLEHHLPGKSKEKLHDALCLDAAVSFMD